MRKSAMLPARRPIKFHATTKPIMNKAAWSESCQSGSDQTCGNFRAMRAIMPQGYRLNRIQELALLPDCIDDRLR
jgi:hypothetical protein